MTLPPALTRNQIKHLRSLCKKKHRHEQRQFLVEGETIVSEILSSATPDLRYLVCTTDYFDSQTTAWREAIADRIYCCDTQTIASISSLDTPTGVLALLDMPLASEVSEGIDHAIAPLSTGLNLYLDGLHDPGNLGTIWRIADWFGVKQLFLSLDCVDLYNPKTIQASMGAFLRVGGHRCPLASLRSEHPELAILGTCIGSGANGLTYHWSHNTLLVIGSESHGVRAESHNILNGWLSIPRGPHSVGAESLNAAVATGILCASYLRAFSQASGQNKWRV